MPVLRLHPRLMRFPRPEFAHDSGLVAVGGDYSPERLLLAYSEGIFPWPHNDSEPLWFSPDPRCVLVPTELHVPRSLAKRLRREVTIATDVTAVDHHSDRFVVCLDQHFTEVITACAETSRPHQDGTWILPDLAKGYIALHEMGLAHSVEVFHRGQLVGGLYGVSLGLMFFGESMFSRMADASKIGFVCLVKQLTEWGFTLIDCQVETEHLTRFGAKSIDRNEFLTMVRRNPRGFTKAGPWRFHDPAALQHP